MSAGVMSCHKTPFSRSSVGRVLDNPFYYGQMRIGGTLFPHCYEPLISKELFDRCKRVRAHYRTQPFEYAAKPFVFRGILRCKHCGAVITSYTKVKKIKGTGEVHKYTYLRCSDKANRRTDCTCPQVNETMVEKQALQFLRLLSIDPRLLQFTLDQMQQLDEAEIKAQKTQIANLRERLGQIDKVRYTFIERESRGDVDSEWVSGKLKDLKKEEERIQVQLQQTTDHVPEVEWTMERLLRIMSNAAKLFESSHTLQKNALLRCFCANSTFDGKNLEIIMKKPFQKCLEGSSCIKWSGRRDSNPRPHGPEPCALPSALRPV